ncbi:MAG TPA: hypothetical protein VFP91_04450 [Vicinamibacterales bacterium]|nr:hypothetical protein [Vicinamibacterales bacterium]
MNPRKWIAIVLTACLIAATSAYGPSATSKTTDFSDIWGVPGEPGWALEIVQNNYTLFATLYVYGPDGQPNWYSAALNYQGSFDWSGTLYRSTGPYFGTVPFNANDVALSEVGTMSLVFPLISSGTLIYSVNGTQVSKGIVRYLLAFEDFNGNYSGVMSQQGTALLCSPADNVTAAPAAVQITQNGTAMTVVSAAQGDTCNFPGVYSQSGHFGRVVGTYVCASGATGTFSFFEMVRNYSDFRARTSITTASGCTLTGNLVGLQVPTTHTCGPGCTY